MDKKDKKQPNLDTFKEYCLDKRVLLVGNSKEIITKNYGSQINSYDIVIRMNHGHPIPKFANQMGVKYNIWSHGFLNHARQSDRQLKEYKKIRDIIDFHIETDEEKLCKKIFDKKAFLIPNNWHKESFENKYPEIKMSTGLNTAIFFVKWVGTMKEFSIVGFDFLQTANPLLGSGSAKKFHNTKIEKKEMVDLLNKSDKYIPFNDNYVFKK
jgi:hypothetical protein